MKVVAVIQARTGSSRFPRKVLAALQGRSLLEHVIERAQAVIVSEVVVATTEDPDDDAVVEIARRAGVATVRGPVDDVLGRFLVAARRHRADSVVRITADCPLLDPELANRVLAGLLESEADYSSNVIPPTFPDGYDVEALTMACLRRLDSCAWLPHEREHVTTHVREHPQRFRVHSVRNEPDLSSLKLSVDYPFDLALVARILSELSHVSRPGLSDVLKLLERQPELRDNALRHAGHQQHRELPVSVPGVARDVVP